MPTNGNAYTNATLTTAGAMTGTSSAQLDQSVFSQVLYNSDLTQLEETDRLTTLDIYNRSKVYSFEPMDETAYTMHSSSDTAPTSVDNGAVTHTDFSVVDITAAGGVTPARSGSVHGPTQTTGWTGIVIQPISFATGSNVTFNFECIYHLGAVPILGAQNATNTPSQPAGVPASTTLSDAINFAQKAGSFVGPYMETITDIGARLLRRNNREMINRLLIANGMN